MSENLHYDENLATGKKLEQIYSLIVSFVTVLLIKYGNHGLDLHIPLGLP